MEEERIDRGCYYGDSVGAEEPVRGPIGAALISYAVGEVGHVGRVVAAEDAIKAGADREDADVIADVRQELRSWCSRGSGVEDQRSDRGAPVVGSQFQLGVPSGSGKGLIEQGEHTVGIKGESGVLGVRNGADV